MKDKKIRVNHDEAADVLYIIFGDARPSYAETLDDGVYVRYDLETDELAGITILDFSRRSKGEVLDLIISENIIPREEQSMLEFLN